MSQFYMVATVIQNLRKKSQPQSGEALKIMAKLLVKSSKNDFSRRLYAWFIKYEDFLNKKSC